MRWGLLSLLFMGSLSSWAGPRVNNGGGVWACREFDGGPVRWIPTHDRFLLESRGGRVGVAAGADPWNLYRERLDFIHNFLPDLANLIRKHPLQLDQVFRLQETEIDLIGDGAIRVRPRRSSCVNGRVGFEQIADFVANNLLIINQSLWREAQLSSVDKAFLLLHEHLYYVLRAENDDQSSWRTQLLVGAIFSDLSIGEIEMAVHDLLSVSSPDRREQDSVVLFPVSLECRVSTYSVRREHENESLRLKSEKTWRPQKEGDFDQGVLDGVGFQIRTHPLDGRPIFMSLEHQASGFYVESLEGILRASFQEYRHVLLSIERKRESLRTILECWTL